MGSGVDKAVELPRADSGVEDNKRKEPELPKAEKSSLFGTELGSWGQFYRELSGELLGCRGQLWVVRKTLGREKNDLPDKKCGWKGKHNTSLPPGWKVERDVSLPPGWKPDQDYTIAIGWKRSYCDDETVPKGWK